MHPEISLAAPRWGHMGENGWSDGMWIWGPLLMIIWLALAVVVTCLLVRSVNNRAAAEEESTGAEMRSHGHRNTSSTDSAETARRTHVSS